LDFIKGWGNSQEKYGKENGSEKGEEKGGFCVFFSFHDNIIYLFILLRLLPTAFLCL
jgi:hypothetical protein